MWLRWGSGKRAVRRARGGGGQQVGGAGSEMVWAEGRGGGKWGGQEYGRGAGAVEERLAKHERKIWATLYQLGRLLQCAQDSSKEIGTMGEAQGRGGGGLVADRKADSALPTALRHIHPAIAHPSWPAVRRVQRFSYAIAAVLDKLGPSEGGGGGGGGGEFRRRLLTAHSIHTRLDLVEEALQEAIRRVNALASLRLAPADRDEMAASQSSSWLKLWYDYKGFDDSEDVSPGATG